MTEKRFSPELKKSPTIPFRIPIQFSIATIPLVQERFSFHSKNYEPGYTLTRKYIEIVVQKSKKTRKELDNYLRECLYKLFDGKAFSPIMEIGMCEFILECETDLMIKKKIKDYLISLKNKKRGEYARKE